MTYPAFVTKSENGNYLNIKIDKIFHLPEKYTDINGYTFAQYWLSQQDELIIRFADGCPFEEAVHSGKLQGQITYDGDIEITDSSENILKSIENNNPNKLFTVDVGSTKFIKQNNNSTMPAPVPTP